MGLHLISYTVSLTLSLMVAYYGTNCCQRVVFKEHFAGFIKLSTLQQPYCFRNICLYRTALLTKRFLTSKTFIGFVQYMKCHSILSFSSIICFLKRILTKGICREEKNHHKIGSIPLDTRNSFAFLKCPFPKKPL